jgi:chromate transporter
MVNGQENVKTVSLDALFIAFLKVALFGLGSGLIWARRVAVEEYRWISEEEFSDIVSICQLMPGPNVVGIATCVGASLRGLVGAIVAASGFVLIPLMIGFTLGVTYLGHAHSGIFQNVLSGASAAAAGLLVTAGIRLLMPYRHRPTALIVAATASGGMMFTKLPLLILLLGTVLFSIVITQIEEVSRQ